MVLAEQNVEVNNYKTEEPNNTNDHIIMNLVQGNS